MVDDAPAEADAFGDEGSAGSHQRLAEAIASLIRDEPCGRTIGLEGSWGAGKSTVVRLLANALASDVAKCDTTAVVHFDAWAHDGDPLRRTFLEALIRALQHQGFLDGGEPWKGLLAGLAHRVRKERTKTKPFVELWARWLAFSALLVPLGAAIVDAELSSNATLALSWDAAVDWPLVVGFSLALAPAIVVVVRLTWLRFKGLPIGKAWSLFGGDSKTKSKSKTLETPEPTSIEFHDYFNQIVGAALHAEGRKLVLIVDNLDRVEPEVALRLWATLQTFVPDVHSRSRAGWSKRLWTIVPYDRTALERLWQHERHAEAEKPESGVSKPGERSRKDNASKDKAVPDRQRRAVPLSFLDKTFPVRFVVPPTSLTKWRGFLLGLLRRAFPEHAESQLESIYRAYDFCRNDDDSPTPRELKRFVNDMVTTYRQCGDAIPMEHVAHYACCVLGSSDAQRFLLTGALPGQRALHRFGDGLSVSTASLWFNAGSETAQELLLLEPIRNGLKQGNVAVLLAMVAGHGERFWAVFSSATRDGLGVTEVPELLSIAHWLRHQVTAKWQGRSEFRRAVELLRAESIAREGVWPLVGASVQHTVDLIALVDDSELTRLVMARAVVIAQGDAGADVVAASALRLVEGMFELGYDADEWQVKTSDSVDGWLATCAALRRRTGEARSWRRIRPTVDSETLWAAVAERISRGQLEHCLDTLIVTPLASGATALLLSKSIAARLAPSNSVNESELNTLAECFDAIPTSATVNRALAETSSLYHLYRALRNPTTRGLLAAELLIADPALQLPDERGKPGRETLLAHLESTQPDIALSLAARLVRRGRLDALFDMRRRRGKRDPLFAACLLALMESEELAAQIPADLLAAEWDDFAAVSAPGLRELIRRFPDRDGIEAQLMAHQPWRPEAALLLAECGALSDRFRTWCERSLAEVKRIEWVGHFESDAPSCRLAEVLAAQSGRAAPTVAYYDAAVDYAAHFARNQKVRPRVWAPERISGFLHVIGPKLDAFRADLLRVAFAVAGQPAKEFLGVWGQELVRAALAHSRRSEVVRELFLPGLRDMNGGWRDWIRQVLEADPRYLADADVGVKRDFVADLEDRIKLANGPEREELSTLLSRCAPEL